MPTKKAPEFSPGERVVIGARTGKIAPGEVPREGGLIPVDMDDGTRWNVAEYEVEREDKTVPPSADRPLKKGDRVTANDEPGVFVEYLPDRPYARVDRDEGGRITVEEAFVKPEKAKKKADETDARRPTHKMIEGPLAKREK